MGGAAAPARPSPLPGGLLWPMVAATALLPGGEAKLHCFQNGTLPHHVYMERGKDDATWVLTSAFVILTMQMGFASLEAGAIERRFAVSVMMKNVIDCLVGGLAYWIFGYGLSFGASFAGLMGTSEFLINSAPEISTSIDLYSHFAFNFAFSSTATTLLSGSVAGRMKFSIYAILSFVNIAIYAVPAHWAWHCQGWLRLMDFIDFAGGGPVHVMGGANALVCCWFVGTREGRFSPKAAPADFDLQNPVECILGFFMLWWGWLGLNCGSTFGVTGTKWLTAGRVAVTTMNASIGGGLFGVAWSVCRQQRGIIHVGTVINSMLASLVAITPGCASMTPAAAILVGMIGSFLAVNFNEAMVRHRVLDDVAGVVGVHLVAGVWGLLAVGIFGEARLHREALGPSVGGIMEGGGAMLLWVQFLGTLAIVTWTVATSLASCLLLQRALGLRGSDAELAQGFDLVHHGHAGFDGAEGMTVDETAVEAMSKQLTRIRVDLLEAKVALESQRWELEAVRGKMSSEQEACAPNKSGGKKALPSSKSTDQQSLAEAEARASELLSAHCRRHEV